MTTDTLTACPICPVQPTHRVACRAEPCAVAVRVPVRSEGASACEAAVLERLALAERLVHLHRRIEDIRALAGRSRAAEDPQHWAS